MLFRPSRRPRYRVQPVTACNSLILLQDWELAFVVFALSRQQPCWLLRCAMTSMPPAPSIRPALPPFVLTSPLLLPPAALHYDFKVPALSLEPATTARGLRLLNGQHLLNSASATAQSVRMCSPPQTMCAPPHVVRPFPHHNTNTAAISAQEGSRDAAAEASRGRCRLAFELYRPGRRDDVSCRHQSHPHCSRPQDQPEGATCIALDAGHISATSVTARGTALVPCCLACRGLADGSRRSVTCPLLCMPYRTCLLLFCVPTCP